MVPFDTETEKIVLSGMMVDAECCLHGTEKLPETAFYSALHRKMFEAMKELLIENKTVDFITVQDRTQNITDDEEIVISEIASIAGSVAGFKNHCEILKELDIRRHLIVLTKEIGANCQKDGIKSENLIAELELKTAELADSSLDKGYMSIGQGIHEAVDVIEYASDHGGIVGLRSGYAGIDKYAQGLKDGHLIVVAALTNEGKTALALNLAERISKGDSPVGMFSLETTTTELIIRMLQTESRINLHEIKPRDTLEKEGSWQCIFDAANRLRDLPIYFCDTTGLNIGGIALKARRMQREHGIKCVMVDYLQLVSGIGQSQQERVDSVSKGLKAMAMSLKIPVIALSQFSREANRRGGVPKLSDLRGSGTIEQDAQVVIMLYNRYNDFQNCNEEYIKNEVAPEGSHILENKMVRELIFAKHKGRSGTIYLAWSAERACFEEISPI